MTTQSQPTSSSELSNRLSDLLDRRLSREEFARQLFSLNVEQVSATDPELAEILRACAIPRRFDAEIIGVLRAASGEHETNERLLQGLLPFSFVLNHSAGGFVYHDSTRDMLLEDWRASDDGRIKFEDYNRRLVDFYEGKYKDARQMEEAWGQVASIVKGVNPSRYAQLASIIETSVIAPLLEALYHEGLRSARAGYDFFTRYYEPYEAKGRIVVCESLLSAARSSLERLPVRDRQESLLKWLDYWQARLARQARRDSEAEDILNKLLPQTGDDTTLKLWVLSLLGTTLQQQEKLSEAHRYYQEYLKISQETQADLYNLPVGYASVANLHWNLSELEEAAGKYREAIQAARDQSNLRMEAFGLLDLSGVLYDRGEWAEALEAALEALHIIHSQFSQEYDAHKSAAVRFMSLMSRCAPRLLETIYAEAKTLAEMSELFQTLYLRQHYVNALDYSGQFERAEEELRALRKDAAGYADTVFGVELMFREALLYEVQGRVDEAIDRYTSVITQAENNRVTAWTHAASLSNRGSQNEKRAHWEEAETDLGQAIAKWEAHGYEKLAAFVRLYRVNALRKQGRLSEAQELLNEVRDALRNAQPSFWADYNEIQGEVFKAQALWTDARACYQQALTIHRSMDNLHRAAFNLTELATVAADQGRWEEATGHTAEANQCWQLLAERVRYQPSEVEKQADQKNARGTTLFSVSSGNRRQNLSQARELFESACLLDPDNLWYYLNLAYACAELEAWEDAAKAVMSAIDRVPEWLRSPSLYKRMAEFRLKRGAQLVKAERYDDAAKCYTDTRAQIVGEAQLGQLANAWLELGDSLLKLERISEAESAYQAALDCATSTKEATIQADSYARLGLMAVIHKDAQHPQLRANEDASPRASFAKAIALYRAGDRGSPGEVLGDVCRTLLHNISDYWALDSEWQACADDPQTGEALRMDLSAARESLSGYLEELLQLGERSGKNWGLLPVVTPIRVEIGRDLIPADNEVEDWVFIETYVPEMRDRLQKEMGVRLPGVRVRGNKDDLPPNSYIIMLDEIPLVMDYVQTGLYYCLAAPDKLKSLGIPESELSPAEHPISRDPGCWVSPVYKAIIADNGLELWEDHLLYIMRHIEAVLCNDLAAFVGVQEVANLLETWSQEKDVVGLIAEALPDSTAKLRFGRVVRALLSEKVSIAPWRQILEAVRDIGLQHDDVHAAVRAVRLRLLSYLPGNSPQATRIFLPESDEREVSRWISEQEGRLFFTIPPEETQDLLSSIREFVKPYPHDVVLITREAEARPFVRRLIELEFPRIMVIAQEELLSSAS